MTVLNRFLPLLAGVALLAAPAGAQRAPLRVVTSTTDLGDLASEVCGNRCQVVHISEGYQFGLYPDFKHFSP